jgi:4-amino-4-deoxy-L-arabinose transferase-like glycosyltransferase
MAMPLAAYLASRARTRIGSLLWIGAAGLVVVGALMTVSRTVVLMVVAMTIVALLVRKPVVTRHWPVALALLAAVHLAAPHTLGSLYHSFLPQGGLVHSQTARGGEVGSGRVADIGPGLRSWKQKPVFGHGLGTGKTSRSTDPGAIVDPKTGAPIIFDDQYLNSLVSIGFVGLAGVLWFVWGAVIRLTRTARRRAGPAGDLVAACAVACAGFGAGMLTFDAFAFVQCTLIFFVIAATGLRARALIE